MPAAEQASNFARIGEILLTDEVGILQSQTMFDRALQKAVCVADEVFNQE